jgi:A/G-specific adenine glycosylase
MLKDFDIEKFQDDLLSWYEAHLRDLPWRKDQDPYKIWVSEVMLQQTRVDTVIPYFERFTERFPTLEALADADTEEVLKSWEGLGYYSRARNLHAGVREVKERYDGRVPDDPDEIRTIKGIGPYTAGAILSIAYGKPEPAVDGNVMRVLSRLLAIREDIQKAKTRKLFEELIRQLIAKHNPSFFNQALMELGALVCTPKSPKCLICPVMEHCRGRAQGIQEDLPIKGKAKPPRDVNLAVAFLEQDGKFLIRKRPDEGLLAGMWELVNLEGDIEALAKQLYADYGVACFPLSLIDTHQHVFSHLQWKMQIYSFEPHGRIIARDNERWISWDEVEQYTFPISFKKIIKKLQKSMDETR